MAFDYSPATVAKDPTDSYRQTLNLPVTEFPMKADLARREPEMLAAWKQSGLYDRILAARAGGPRFVMHDGPPSANGNIHYGHILNKILKDLVVKYRTMTGALAVYKPGWDTHGLPIELQVDRTLGDKKAAMSKLDIRAACHAHAMKYVDIQRTEFQRLGIFGTWDDPYLTLNKSYEATIVRELAKLARAGFLYKGKKPVHWCASCRTALAEAEVEHADKTSPSIYVAFRMKDHAIGGVPAAVVIWTTTPWTLPANLAVVLHPDFEYVGIPATLGGERQLLVVARDLAARFAAAVTPEVRASFAPEAEWVALGAPSAAGSAAHALIGKQYRHPLLDSRAEVDHRAWTADHVTTEAGTGIVHTAPGHGADDYKVGVEHGLEIYAPVDDGGKFLPDTRYAGQFVFKANANVIADLVAAGALLSDPAATIKHSYPHCWRCKNAVIFRATPQWFCSMEHNQLRQHALDEIGRTRWIPPWGENRIRGMIENRPDWCLSRQRVWGVPIPTFINIHTGEALADADVMEHIANLFAEHGADAWFAREATDLLPPGWRHGEYGAADFRKDDAIVDVWFESGVSWAAVCEPDPGMGLPVDLYLEGSDQHRGWFHSSLLASVAARGKAPFKSVLTHGFVVDQDGNAYSKSAIEEKRRRGIKIDYTAPEDQIKKTGAELLRMWVAGAEFRNDIAYSPTVLEHLTESYRRIRNTFRFLLGNLSGFDPARDCVADDALEPFDLYILTRVRSFARKAAAAYDDYTFHTVLKDVVDLCAVDLSALFIDVTKDRLYCEAAASPRRRSAQTVTWHVARTLATIVAPIMVFTAEDVWKYLPRAAGDPDSVHLMLMAGIGAAPAAELAAEAAVLPRWEALLALRAEVQRALEPFRREKHASLDARAIVRPTAAQRALCTGPDAAAMLAELFIVSEVVLEATDATGEVAEVRVEHATGTRCPRCWRWGTPAGLAGHPDLDARCAEVVAQLASNTPTPSAT